MSRSITIIAEAGVNHNEDLGMALRLVDVAADAGVDFVKFQTFLAARKANYQVATTGGDESHLAMLRRLELSGDAHTQIVARCRERSAFGVEVGNHCCVSTTAVLNGDAMIGDGTFVGSRAVIREGVRIGRCCLIGMGAIVRHDLSDEPIFYGTPQHGA